MNETGKVTKIQEGKATVRIDKKDECAKCGMCLFPSNANYTEFEVINTLNAEVGDTVTIERKSAVLSGALFSFFIPLVLIAIGAVIGLLVIKSDFWTLGICLGVVALWFLIIAITEKYRKNMEKYFPTMTEIVIKNSENNKEKENG